MEDEQYITFGELEAGLDFINQSPRESGELKLIVCRPGVDRREILSEAMLDVATGLVGDSWHYRGSPPDAQITLMNSRVISLLAPTEDRWALAGDQLYVDLDLSVTNVPPGTQLVIGSAIVEVTALPHTGCQKFAARFGHEALKFVNAPPRKELRLRGVHARVVQAGRIRAGDRVEKKAPAT